MRPSPNIPNRVSTPRAANACTSDADGASVPGRQVDPVQAADFLGTTPGQLARWRKHGGGPRFVWWVSNSVRYRLVDLIEWQENHLFENSIQSQESAS